MRKWEPLSFEFYNCKKNPGKPCFFIEREKGFFAPARPDAIPLKGKFEPLTPMN